MKTRRGHAKLRLCVAHCSSQAAPATEPALAVATGLRATDSYKLDLLEALDAAVTVGSSAWGLWRCPAPAKSPTVDMNFDSVAEMMTRISHRRGAMRKNASESCTKRRRKLTVFLKTALSWSSTFVPDTPPVPIRVVRRLVSYVKRSELSLPELFAMIDKDGSGSVDVNEFRAGLRSVGLSFSDADIDELLKLVDADGDGELECDEFCSCMDEIIEQDASSGPSVLTNLCNHLHVHGTNAQELFDSFDDDNTGDLDAKEFHAILVQVGINVSETAARQAMNELDLDGDGQLEISELVNNIAEFQRKRRVFAAKTLGKVCDYVKQAKTSVARVFSRVDSDDSGNLDVLEMQEAFRKMGQDLSELEVEEIMQELGGTSSATMTTTGFLDKLKQFEAERIADTSKCEALFRQFDSDCSGSLDREEVKVLAGELGLAEQVQDPNFLAQLISDIEDARVDLDDDNEQQDGTVSYDEFLPWFLANGRSFLPRPTYPTNDTMETPSNEELHGLFNKIDTDGSGGVSQTEAQEAVAMMFPYVGLRNTLIAYDAADADGSGVINMDEFVSLFLCLMFLNKRRHTIDEIFEQFDEPGLDDGNFWMASTLLQVDLTDIEATRYFTMLCLDYNVDKLSPDHFLSWLVRRECIGKLDADAQDEQVRQWQIAQLEAVAGEYGDVYMEDLAEVVVLGTRRRKALVNGNQESGVESSKHQSWKQRISKAARETIERTNLLRSGIQDCLERSESFPDLTDEALSDMLSSIESEVFFSGQNIITQGMAESTFFVIRRGAANVVLDDETVIDSVRAGSGVGELAMLFGFKRNATIQCTGPCEVYRIDRADYETSVALMPPDMRKSSLEQIMERYWDLVTGPGGSRRPQVDYKVYLQLSVRVSKTLTTLADMEGFDEEEQREIAQADWSSDCQRYGLKTTGSLQESHFFNSIYELVDLWAADLEVSFVKFLTNLFDNIAEWTDDLGGHWKFKGLETVRCEGDKFEALKDDARAAAEEAERARKAQEMEWEQGRLRDEMLAKERKEKMKALKEAQEAELGKKNELRHLQMKLLALDEEEAELRRRLAAGGLTPEEEDELRRRLAAIQQEKIQLKHQIADRQQADLMQLLESGGLSLEEERETRKALARLEQARFQLQIDALDAEVAEHRRQLASGLLSSEEEEAIRRRLAVIAQEKSALHIAMLDAEERELQRRLAAGTLTSTEAELRRQLALGLIAVEDEETIRVRLAKLARERIAAKLRTLDMEEEELLRLLEAGGLSSAEEEELRQRLARIAQQKNQLKAQALALEEAELQQRLSDGSLSAEEKETIRRRLAALDQERVQLKIDALDAEESELTRRLATGLLCAEEEEALRQRLAAIAQERSQLDSKKLILEKSELQRRLSVDNLSAEEVETMRRRLAATDCELAQLQIEALKAERVELQRRLANGTLSDELLKRLAMVDSERSHFEMDAIGVEALELRRRLQSSDHNLSTEEEEALHKRLAELDQQVDTTEKEMLGISDVGTLHHSGDMDTTTHTQDFGGPSQCEFQDETRMFVSFLKGKHSPMRPVSPLQPRDSDFESSKSRTGTLDLAQEMDAILERWKRMRTSVRHGACQGPPPLHFQLHACTSLSVCVAGYAIAIDSCFGPLLAFSRARHMCCFGGSGGTGKSRWMVDNTVRHAVGLRTNDSSWSRTSLPSLAFSPEPVTQRQSERRKATKRRKTRKQHRRSADLPMLRMMAAQREH